MLDAFGKIGVGRLGLEGEEFPDDAKDVAMSSCRVELELLLIGV